MPQWTKQGQRQTSTPSPTPGDILNTLLLVKDTVNSTLLNQHTRFADLSSVLSDVENQIRDAFETTIKALKTEIEKRKRRVVPGIKKLQDILKSLSKSETQCKTSEKGYKNAVAKKAKRRIKDTQKFLKEFITSDVELSMSIFVSDQITTLCQRLVHIPPTIGALKTQIGVCETARIDESESDSESSRSESRNDTPIDHIYNEIETNTFQRMKHDVFKENKDSRHTRRKHPIKHNDASTNKRLNSVVLFSSDSESDENEDQFKTHSSSVDGEPSASEYSSKYKPEYIPGGNTYAPDYEQLIQPALEDVFKHFTTNKHANGKQHCQSLTKTPVLIDDYEIPVQTKTDNSFAPIRHNSDDVSLTQGKSSKKPATTNTQSKRLLPATPTTKLPEKTGNTQTYTKSSKKQHVHPTLNEIAVEGIDCIDSSQFAYNTCFDNIAIEGNTGELLTAAQHLLNDIQPPKDENEIDSNTSPETEIIKSATDTLPQGQVKHTTLIESDYVDIEEIKFRETVRTARREILDKLKSRCTHNDKSESYFDNGSSLNSKARTFSESVSEHDKKNSQGKELPYSAVKHDAGSSPLRQETNRQTNYQSKDVTIKGVYKSRLVHTFQSESPTPSVEYRPQTNESCESEKQSMVSATIYKFENASHTLKTLSGTGRKLKPANKYGHYTKVRSASEPRTTGSRDTLSSTTRANEVIQNKDIQSKRHQYSTKALLPRAHSTDAEGIVIEDKSKYLTKSSTESDLLKLIANESSSSIRKQWSKRRSLSMTPKITVPDRKSTKVGPEYEPHASIILPDHSTRCYISSIVVIQNDSLVLLDETHRYMHLFDSHHKHNDSYRLLDTPKSCVKVNESTVAISFPYKKSVCMYTLTIGAILSDREITVPCSKWIVDIAYCGKLFYVLCKDGDVHVLSNDGSECNRVCLGMSGKLFLPSSGNRLFVLGENTINKFNAEGVLLTSKSGIDAHSMIVIENKIYIADRQSHRIVPLLNTMDVPNLTSNDLMYPLAMCCSINGTYLFVSQFEESMDVTLTRSIQVLKLKDS